MTSEERTENVICRDCGGSGCETCKGSGYYKSIAASRKNPISIADSIRAELVPMPYGKLIAPDLRNSYNYNRPTTPADQIILCPECESDHTCFLPSEDVWFCISCRECWKYERET